MITRGRVHHCRWIVRVGSWSRKLRNHIYKLQYAVEINLPEWQGSQLKKPSSLCNVILPRRLHLQWPLLTTGDFIQTQELMRGHLSFKPAQMILYVQKKQKINCKSSYCSSKHLNDIFISWKKGIQGHYSKHRYFIWQK